ncbi:MAG: hypothetical protein ACKVU2_13830 [Saprospiraceae bacterium]
MQTFDRKNLLSKLADVPSTAFAAQALTIFQYQAANNTLYARYLHLLGR